MDDEEWYISIASTVMHNSVKIWMDNDADVFPTYLYDYVRRFNSLENIVTAENKLPRIGKNTEAHYISIMKSGGKVSEAIFWMDKSKMKKLNTDVSNLTDKYKTNIEDLKGLFCLLGEYLTKESVKKKN